MDDRGASLLHIPLKSKQGKVYTRGQLRKQQVEEERRQKRI